MKKYPFAVVLAMSGIALCGQADPLYSYNLPLRQINAIPYDSIAVIDDMDPQKPALQSARYVFYQNKYVGGGHADNGQKSVSYGFALSGGNPQTFEMDRNTGDTLRSIIYLGNGNGQDSAVKIFDHQSAAAPKLSSHLKYFYTPQGEVDSTHSVHYRADTVWYAQFTKNYFTGNRIDSVISQRLTSTLRFKSIYFYTAQNRLQYSENYSNVTGPESYSGRDTYIYNTNDEVQRIDLELALPGSQVLVPFEIIEFHQSPVFSLREEQKADIQIYPNPAAHFIRVKAHAKNMNQSYEILTLTGELVQKGVLQKQIDLGFLQSGLYILRLGAQGATYKFRKI